MSPTQQPVVVVPTGESCVRRECRRDMYRTQRRAAARVAPSSADPSKVAFPTLAGQKPSCPPTHQPIKGLNAEPGGKAVAFVGIGKWGG